MRRDRRGFTLIEIMVVMVLFVVVIAITGQSFQTILKQSAKLFRSEESNIEGMVGLEMMRHDIQQAGYGLFTQPSPVTYGEATGSPASTYNETTNTAPPRAVAAGDNLPAGSGTVVAGTDYLVIKGTTVGRTKAAQKWTHLVYAPGGAIPNIWTSGTENFSGGDNVILLRRSISTSGTTTTLISNPPNPPDPSSGAFYYSYSPTAFGSYSTNSWSYFVYGLNSPSGSSPPPPRMPF
ncbi:MAG TPA: prepilin-type N-terminal cleavage/methylation domain-containing protein, partial [Desulfuromonadaceae bacterium]